MTDRALAAQAAMQDVSAYLSNDEIRWASAEARKMTAPSDTTSPMDYVRAGAAAMLSKLRAPVADEECKRCGGPGWYTSHTTGYPESIPCSACNPQGVSVERLAKDPFLAAQLWRKPAVADGSLLERILEHVGEYGESMASSALLSIRSIARRNVETRIAAELAALASAPVAKPKRAPLDDWRVQAIADCLETEWDEMSPDLAESYARAIVGYLIEYEKESGCIEAQHAAEPVHPVVQAVRKLRASAPVADEREMSLSVALHFADFPRPYHTLEAPADTNGELYRALAVLAREYRAALASALVPMSDTERKAITGLIAVARAAFNVAEDAEDDGPQIKLDRTDAVKLGEALDTLDELPDDQPGYSMGPSNKAEWALRRVLGLASAPVAGEAVGKVVLFGGDLKEVSWTAGRMPPPGTTLYAAPQASEEPK